MNYTCENLLWHQINPPSPLFFNLKLHILKSSVLLATKSTLTGKQQSEAGAQDADHRERIWFVISDSVSRALTEGEERRGGGGIKRQINAGFNPKYNLKEAWTHIMGAVALEWLLFTLECKPSVLNVQICSRCWYVPEAYNECKVMQSAGSLYHKSSSLALSANITYSPDWLTASVRFPAIMSSPFSFHSVFHMWVIRLEAVGVSPSSWWCSIPSLWFFPPLWLVEVLVRFLKNALQISAKLYLLALCEAFRPRHYWQQICLRADGLDVAAAHKVISAFKREKVFLCTILFSQTRISGRKCMI